MGMYTELYLGIRLKKDTPDEVINAIQRIVNSTDLGSIEKRRAYIQSTDWPDHPFFKTERFYFCFYGSSYYFDAGPFCQFTFDDLPSVEAWSLTFVANIKNYGQEWQHFLAWIAPHIDGECHIGHIRYEENELPTLLYAKDGEIKRIKIPEPEWLQ